MTDSLSEPHPLEPFLPTNARLLILGSFPPPKNRWSMNFFYPNLQNDMWRIMGMLFYADKNIFIDCENKMFRQADIKCFLEEKGIALYDTAQRVYRKYGNASDSCLEIMESVSIERLLCQIPHCKAIAATGERAATEIARQYGVVVPSIGGKTGLDIKGRAVTFYRMPSTSRAYPLPIGRKAAFYCGMFRELGFL